MFEWCERLMEVTGCDFDTAIREYQAVMRSDTYESEDYEEDY